MSVLRSYDRAQIALEQNLWSMWGQFGRGPQCTLHDGEGVLWFETPIPVPPYNMVVRFQGSGNADAAIDRIFSRFRSRRVPFLWFLHPSAEPADLTARLGARGFEELEEIAGMAADLDDLPPCPDVPAGIHVQEVTPGQELAPFMEFVATRWSVPEQALPHLQLIAETFHIGRPGSPNRAWIAVQDGVALAKVFTHECDGVVGVYGMATRLESRGLGLGRNLCIRALAAARARGSTFAVLHSTPMAAALYRSIGFHEVAPFSLYGARGSFYA